MRPALVVSCEHASNAVPARFRALFTGAEEALASHAGWDPGALVVARAFERRFDAPLFATEATRLLVDTNRSESSLEMFSPWTRNLEERVRAELLDVHWRPHRERVEAAVRDLLAAHAAVLHVSVHSFTPVWRGEERDVDVGLLFDPERPGEARCVDAWLAALAARAPNLRLARNRPYLGTADGLTTTLRDSFEPQRYFGIELELNQALVAGPEVEWRALLNAIETSLGEAIDHTATLDE
ncbi:MAG: N-formylglutamate amidohydrolase [Planctomycetota bacterium]